MDTRSTIFLIIIIVVGIFLFRIITRIFLKVILVLILGVIALYLFWKGGAISF